MSAQISALLHKAWQLQSSEQWDEMLALAAEARELSARIRFSPGRPRALAVEAFVHYIRSDLRPLWRNASSLSALAGVTLKQKRVPGACWRWSTGALEITKKLFATAISPSIFLNRPGDEVPKAFAYAVKGGILLSVGDLDEALALHQRSIEVFQSAPDEVVGKARARPDSDSHLAQKRHEEALAALLEALALARQANHRVSTARALNDVGEAFEALGDDEQALRFHTEALEIRREDNYRRAEAAVCLPWGALLHALTSMPKRLDSWRWALRISEELGLKPRIAQCHHALADVYQSTGQLAPALQHVLAWEKAKSELAVDEASLRYRALAPDSVEKLRLRPTRISPSPMRAHAAKQERVARWIDTHRRAHDDIAQCEASIPIPQRCGGPPPGIQSLWHAR